MKFKIALAVPVLALMFAGVGRAGDAARRDAQGSAQAEQEAPKRVHVAGDVQQAKVIHTVDPVYPEFAKKDRIEGTVVLRAIIAKDGTVQMLEYVSGPKELMRAAIEGVNQWRYAPTLVDGELVQVETTITVVFTLDGGDAGAKSETAAPEAKQDAKPDAKAGAVDPQLRADILHMLDVAHVKEQMAAVMQGESQTQRPILAKVFPDTPNRDKIVDRFFEKLVQAVTTPEATEDLVQIYARYYSDEDVKSLTKFYEGPLGQKFVDVGPRVAADSIQWASKIGEKAAPEILQQLCSEYPEIRDQARFCTAEEKK